MEKLKLRTPDFTMQNIARLVELFPNCVTEGTDDQGRLKKAIDFDLLRQELSDSVVDGPRERYHLDWPEKKKALLAANTPIAKTLRPCREESVDFDTTKNLFIEGDNLDALKLLQETYLNKVKMIYIDPPYNTGKDFIYRDNFTETRDAYLHESGQHDADGNRLVANTESNGRFHSDWLSMIYPRLKLARNLLRDEGMILISIDDNEVHNLRKVCDEIFGENGFLAEFVWKSRQFTDARSRDKISTDHEYLVCYACSDAAAFRGINRDESKYKNPDNDDRGPWMSRSILGLATRDQRPNLHYLIKDPSTGIMFNPPQNTGWRYGKERMNQLIANECILFPSKADGRPREKQFRADLESEFTSFPSILDDVHTSHGTAEVRGLFGLQVFDFPKPMGLLNKLLQQILGHDDIVVDLFAGSCTTAHAVMTLNASEGSRRRYIMVQLDESCIAKSNACKEGFHNIAELGKERIRRACKKIKEENATTAPNLDIGFRVFKVDTSNIKDMYYSPDTVKQANLFDQIDNIKADRTPEDLLFQVLLDWGVELTLPIRKETFQLDKNGEFRIVNSENGSDVKNKKFHSSPFTIHSSYEVYFVDENALAACFDSAITEELVKKIAERKPLRAVFRNVGFGSDSVKINVEQIFKLISPRTEVKSI